MELKIIARIHTDFPTKFGLPRQSGLAEELSGTIVFEKEYRNPDALRGIEDFSHVWLIWGFSEGFASSISSDSSWSPTVRPPRLGGNRRMGIFATRSPNRPNPIALSCVKIEAIEKTVHHGHVIHVSGIDMMDGSPIYDIKPYLPHTESIPDAKGGFALPAAEHSLEVEFDSDVIEIIPKNKRESLITALAGDPRPSYQNDPKREYGFLFAGFEVKFKVDGKLLTVFEIQKNKTEG